MLHFFSKKVILENSSFYKINSQKNNMTTEETTRLASEIFNADPQIVHLGILDMEGNVLLDQSSAASFPSNLTESSLNFAIASSECDVPYFD